MGAGGVGAEQLADEGLRHHAGDRSAVDGQPDQRTPQRQAGDEGPRAVDRIDHPLEGAVAVLAAELLAKHAVPGIGLANQRPDGGLGLAVGLGDRIEPALGLVEHCPALAEARQGLSRRSRGNPAEKAGIGQGKFVARHRLSFALPGFIEDFAYGAEGKPSTGG